MPRRLVLLAGALLAVLVGAPAAHAKTAANFSWTASGKVTNLGPGSLDSVSCPTVSLCVAGGSKAIWITTSASAKAGQWKRVDVSQPHPTLGKSYVYEVSCPTAAFCAVGDSNTNVITSTTPSSAQRTAWAPRTVPNTGVYAGIGGLFCPSPTLCAVSDYNGGAITTTNPLGGAWASAKLSTVLNSGIYDVACAGSTCASVQSDKFLWVTSDATAQPATWRKLSLGNAQRRYQAVACKSATVCVAAGYGPLRVSTNAATGGAGTWKAVALPRVSSVEHVNCTPALCTATAGTDVWWSATPQSAASWKKSASGSRVILSDTACPTPKLCVATNVGGQIFVGRR